MIGIFDSGLGGLTVVREIQKRLPNADIRYLGDTARLPYGTKSSKTVLGYIEESTRFLTQKRDLSALVIACNTASAVWLQSPKAWRQSLEKSIGVPVLDVVQPAAKQALQLSSGQAKKARKANKRRRIGVIGTPTTIASGIYQKHLEGLAITAQSCPLLVPFIEEGWEQYKEMADQLLARYLAPLLDARVDTLILGCTHYPLIEEEIRAIMGADVAIVNSAHAVAEELERSPEGTKEGRVEVFVTDRPHRFDAFSEAILGKHIRAELISLDPRNS